MGMSRWWMLGAVLPLVVGCGGSGSSDDDREQFGVFAGFGQGSSPSAIVDTVTATRFEASPVCFEEEIVDDVSQASENMLETTEKFISLPLAHTWINNALDVQRVEVGGAGFEVSIYQEVEGAADTLIWNNYQDSWVPDTGKDKDEADLIRAKELTDEEKLEEIAALPDLVCYKPVNELDSSMLTTIDIPQSERLPPHNPADWPTPPETANTIFYTFNGWSEDGGIEAVAGEYYALFTFNIHLLGESKPSEIRRDFTISD